MYFEAATGCFEEAGELYEAGDKLAAIDSIRAGVRTIACALQVATTQQGRATLQESLDFWANQLIDLSAEIAVEAGRVAVQAYCQASFGDGSRESLGV